MPFVKQQWGDLLNCAVCTGRFDLAHLPCSLICNHTICAPCLNSFRDGSVTKCPLDQTEQKLAIGLLPVNTSILELLQLDWKHSPAVQDRLKISLKVFREDATWRDYLKGLEKLENLATVVSSTEVLNKPLQRKLMSLFQCQIMLEEGRIRALKAARSVCERIVIELILQHQNQQQLTMHLWSAVRARGCQFLGPAMQEEVLKLVLLALESGSALSRKVLVMFIVQKLKSQYAQASKTSVGHVVQLLYRASCFKVSKRDGDSSLMELKEEFRTYDALRKEHDAQVIQIAQEAGLRIAPEQWSSLLYGDQQHKSPMQSIVDKLQTSQFFSQSIQELLVAIQRSGDPESISCLSEPLNFLADIEVGVSGTDTPPSMQLLAAVLSNVVDILVAYLRFMGSVHSVHSVHSIHSVQPVQSVQSVYPVQSVRFGRDCNQTVRSTRQMDNLSDCLSQTRSSLLHQPLCATRSLPHTTRGNGRGNTEGLPESFSVMDLNRNGHWTAQSPQTGQLVCPVSFSAGPAHHTSRGNAPFSARFSLNSALPSSSSSFNSFNSFSSPNSFNSFGSTGSPNSFSSTGSANFGLSFLTPPTSQSVEREESAVWPDVYSEGRGEKKTLPTSLSSGSLLDDYARWKDDAATTNGIHRIGSLANNLHNLHPLVPQVPQVPLVPLVPQRNSQLSESSQMFFVEEGKSNSVTVQSYGQGSNAAFQSAPNRHVLLGRR